MRKYFRWKAVFLLFLICIPAILTAQKPAITSQAKQFLNKTNKSLFFIENKGQWPKQVKFLARLGGMNCWITDSGVVYDYFRIDRDYSPDSLMMLPPNEKEEFERTHTSCKGHVVRMDYNGINLNAEKQGTDKREAYYNYFIGNDSTKWASFVGLYGEVLVKDAYQGIDIRYYFDSGQIRYDYLVNPGADITQISFRLTGADALAVNKNGELIIKTSLGEVKHGKLYAFQQFGNEIKEVSCRFERKEDGNFGVIASNYEKGMALVIDPLVWSTFIGGTDVEFVCSITLVNNFNVCATGNTASSNYPTTSGAYDVSFNGGMNDIFITKLNSNATSLIYSTFIGGTYTEQGISITSDVNNNTFITGYTNSNNFPTTSGAYDKTYNGILGNPNSYNGYILKLNSSGSALIYSTYIGGKGGEFPTRITIDKSGNAYITGETASTDFPTTTGAYDTTQNGSWDVFVVKINPIGSSLIFSTFIGGNLEDYGESITTDSSHNIYVTGATASSNYPTTLGAYDQTHNGGYWDAFITKLNPNGSLLIFSTFFGGSLNESSYDIALDSSGNIFITGETGSTNFPITIHGYDTTFNNDDIFISKFNPSTSILLASTFLGGSNTEGSRSIAISSDHYIYITGHTKSNDFPITNNAIQTVLSGVGDSYVAKLNPDLSSLLFSTFLGGTDDDYCNSICTDINNNPYVAGWTNSSNFPTTTGVYDQSLSGNADGFVLKIDIFKQSDSIKAQNINCSKMNISWEKGDGIKRVVFMKATNIGFPVPVDSTFYNANNIFGSGAQIGSSGWYCVYNDTGTTVSVSGLKPETYYRIMVLEYKGTMFNEIYTTYASMNNPVNKLSDSLPSVSFSINDRIQCMNGNNSIFTNNSKVTSGTFTSLWRFGDGVTSSQQNPFHSYTTSDSFYVKLIVTNGANCKDSLIKTILINPSPIALFSIIDSIQCMKWNKFIFTNNSSINKGSLTSKWQFGDGTNSFNKNPLHSYANADSFLVKLIVVSDSGCIDSITGNAYVYANPISKFVIYDSSQCLERNNFGFINTSSFNYGKLSYLWNFGDGDTSTFTNPSHSYLIADTFTVLLVANSDKNCIDSFSSHTYIHVHPKPLSNFTINDSTQCLNGNFFVLSNNSTIKSGTFNTKWDFADGFDTNSYNANHSYSIADSYMVKLLIISDWACKDSILKTIIVYPMPVPAFIINDTVQCFKGNSFTFANRTSISSGLWLNNWDFGDGNTSIDTTPFHIYSSDGKYKVKLVATSGLGCVDSSSKIVYVYPSPVADFSIDKNPQYLPFNKFRFTNKSIISSGINSYLWNFGDGNTSKATDTVHSYNLADTFEVMLIANSGKGCSDTIRKFVYVKTATIIADFNVTNVCLGDTVFFQNTSQIINDTFQDFIWDFGDKSGIQSSKNPFHIYKDTGTYTVTMIAKSKNGFKDSTSHIIHILPIPQLSITYVKDTIIYVGQKVTLTANGTFDQVLWSTGEQTTSITVDTQGIYNVVVTDVNGCKSSGLIRIVVLEKKKFSYMNVITPNGDGINDLWKIDDIKQYQPCKLAIYNRWGDELYSNNNYNNDWNGTYKGKSLPEGTYYFVLVTKDGIVYKGAVNILR